MKVTCAGITSTARDGDESADRRVGRPLAHPEGKIEYAKLLREQGSSLGQTAAKTCIPKASLHRYLTELVPANLVQSTSEIRAGDSGNRHVRVESEALWLSGKRCWEPVSSRRGGAPVSLRSVLVTAMLDPEALYTPELDLLAASSAKVGYARVSTSGQLLDRQLASLTTAGCIRVFADKKSGKNAEREELRKAPDYLRPGDALVVASLDRLDRSLGDLISIVTGLRRRGVGFASLHEAIDTTTPGGRLVFHVFAALAEFIREMIIEGTREGLEAA